jgi:CubicO group peptidase (beta-lactamase class C family)
VAAPAGRAARSRFRATIAVVRPLVAVVVACSLTCTLSAQSAAQPAAAEARFASVVSGARRLPRLHSLLVSQRGELVLEHYARGVTASRLANVKSASKSIISALVGVAIDRTLIANVRQPVATWFPELRRDPDPRKAAITIEDLLTMRSGLETTSNRNYGAWVTSANWVRFVLTRKLLTEPGTSMQYSTGSTHLLSAILTKASGTSTRLFAQRALGSPLGITFAPWPRDPQGIYFGGNDMLLTPRQMVALGELYLNDGRVRGQQVVPAGWVTESCAPKTTSRFDAGREYGYGWWIDEVGGHRSCYAWGYGGQYILVFDDLQTVVVATSSTATGDERRGYRRELLDLIGQEILPVLRPTTESR